MAVSDEARAKAYVGLAGQRVAELEQARLRGRGDEVTAVADAPPSNWMTLASMQRLAKRPSSFAT